ncbi:hypothetical protein [Nocardia carnea]|uniref:hypothetical protein n=1 Tax=Nocardia carnea TaxID=37328 RepID=UPI0024559CB0|nr:hypothetical protein [Nocardia carnea]
MDGNTPPAPAANPWPKLKKLATAGDLVFEQGAALKYAELAADAIGGLLSLRKVAKEVAHYSPVSSPFSNLNSGEALAKVFAAKGEELDRILGDHVEILQSMKDTFVAAGKAYDAGEADNARLFDGVRVTPKDIGGPSLTTASELWKFYDPRNLTDPRFGSRPNERLENSRVVNEDLLGSAENHRSMSYPALYTLGAYIGGNHAPLRALQAADKWHWMAQGYKEIFDDLRLSVDGLKKQGNWDGIAADQARRAVFEYAKSTESLIYPMNLIGDNLWHVGRWLEGTRRNMPDEGMPQSIEMGQGGYRNKERFYQDLMKHYYVDGYAFSAGKVPVLPVAYAPYKTNPGGHDKPRGRDTVGPVGGAGGGSPMPDLSATNMPQGPALVPDAPVADDAAERAMDLAGQQVMQAGQQAAQQAMQAAQQMAQHEFARQTADQAMRDAEALRMSTPGVPSGVGGLPGGGVPKGAGVSAPTAPKSPQLNARLFPRASLAPAATLASAARPIMPPLGGMGTPGSPGPAGSAAQAGRDNDGRKSPEYLNSTEYLTEALGDSPLVSKPVLDR